MHHGHHADRHDKHTLPPRSVWAGLIAVLLAAGAAVAARGRTHGTDRSGQARPVRGQAPTRARVQGGAVRRDRTSPHLLTGPAVRRDARRSDRVIARVEAQRAAAPRPGLLRAAAVLLLVGFGLVLGSQGLYAHTPLGQDNAVRDLGLAVLTGLAGLRLLVGTRPGRIWSGLAGCAGLALFACALLTSHDDSAGVVVEAVAGAWIAVAAAMSLDRGQG